MAHRWDKSTVSPCKNWNIFLLILQTKPLVWSIEYLFTIMKYKHCRPRALCLSLVYPRVPFDWGGFQSFALLKVGPAHIILKVPMLLCSLRHPFISYAFYNSSTIPLHNDVFLRSTTGMFNVKLNTLILMGQCSKYSRPIKTMQELLILCFSPPPHMIRVHSDEGPLLQMRSEPEASPSINGSTAFEWNLRCLWLKRLWKW